LEAALFDRHRAAMNLVGWVERSDTHQSRLAKMMGFAKGSIHRSNYGTELRFFRDLTVRKI
jgi:hypothetical protein